MPTAGLDDTATRSLRETRFMGWPAFELRQGPLALHLVPAIGGRLMGIGLDGEPLCFVNPALQGRQAGDDPAAWRELCGGWDFPLWGGGKTWLAPESAWPGGAPHRDLDSGAWSVAETWFDAQTMGIELRSAVCRDSGLQLSRRLSLPSGGTSWSIEHHAVNRGRSAYHGGLWDVLMLRRPACVSVALPAGLAPQWRTAVRALPGKPSLDTLLRTGVLQLAGDRIELHCDRPGEFKCGFDSDTGDIRADLPSPAGTLRYQRRSALPPAARYAHGHPLEVFNASALPYFEIESHAPAATLQPGEHAHFVVDESVHRLPPPFEGAHT